MHTILYITSEVLMGEVKRYQKYGAPFQILLVSAFIFRTYAFWSLGSLPVATEYIIDCVSALGMVVGNYYLFILYRKDGREKLITGGVFRYTRHPMYTGLILMDIQFWFTQNYNTFFWISTVVFYVSIITAGYFQEKETVARFGLKAKRYYAHTPRLFFVYPFRNLRF